MRENTKQFKKHQAMTLVELLIYLAITMIVLVVVIDLVTRVAQNKSSTSGQEEIMANTRFLNERLTYAIQSASSINGSYPADNLHLTINGTDVAFTLADGQIFYQEGVGTAVALTNSKVKISALAGGNIFRKIANADAQSVEIKFTVISKQNNLSRDFQTSVLARGK